MAAIDKIYVDSSIWEAGGIKRFFKMNLYEAKQIIEWKIINDLVLVTG